MNLRPDVEDPPELAQLGRRLMNRLDEVYRREHPSQPQVDTRIATYQLAARMQLEASDALDLSQETKATLAMYGVGQGPALQGIQYRNPGPDNYARCCIMARRLVERGVRYVQICLNNQIWDTHAYLEDGIRGACDRTDKPVAALLADLKQRGLLDSTLVVWGGEFGRLPNGQMTEGNKRGTLNIEGRDHNSKAFSLWLAGEGSKGEPFTGRRTTWDFASSKTRSASPTSTRRSFTNWASTIASSITRSTDSGRGSPQIRGRES